MIPKLVFFSTVFVRSLSLPLIAEFFVFCELLPKIISAVSWQCSKSMNTLKGLGHETEFKFFSKISSFRSN